MSLKSDLREERYCCPYYFNDDRELENKTDDLNTEIKQLNDKIKELQQICFRYIEEGYKFIGYLKNECDVDSRAIEIYRGVIDSCISDNEYKYWLYHNYISKDLDKYNKLFAGKVNKLTEEVKQFETEFINDNLNDFCEEDDTESLVIVEKDPREEILNKLSDEDKKLYYDIMNKEFIDNTVNKDFNQIFEETKPKKERKTYKDGLKEAQEEEELRNRWANYDPNTDMGQ